ncbi:MAG: hydroxymethylbilane synthase [Desulfovibrio sp.]|nr:hydroxymethylbilane synthase [Desulfovibrio sp.]
MRKHLVIATRGSQLALWQAKYVQSALCKLHPDLSIELAVIKTRGDIILDVPLAKVGGKGLFVKEIEDALLGGRADLAVHSIKDVPMFLPEGLLLGCVPKREDPRDALLSLHYDSLEALPKGARIGTSSLRRQAQLLNQRPDLVIANLRGNVDTRLRKLTEGAYDAILLASAGLTRLGLTAPKRCDLQVEHFLPAVGQGALGIECREDDYDVLCLLAELEDGTTRVCVEAERGFLAELDGGCQVPIAGHATLLADERLEIKGLVGEVDGSRLLSATRVGEKSEAEALGRALARELLDMGARAILQKLYEQSEEK